MGGPAQQRRHEAGSRGAAGARLKVFFEDIWRGHDPWALEVSPFERDKYRRQIDVLGPGRFSRVLEVGCGAGAFTRLLAERSGHVTALDVAPSSIARARARFGPDAAVELREANIMEEDLRAGGPWDLIVMSETIYYIGWLYPFFDVAWLASELFGATRPGGRFLMANTFGEIDDHLMRPWIIRTYRDLFVNVGYGIEHEEVFHGIKDGIELDVLITLYGKATDGGGPAPTPAIANSARDPAEKDPRS